MENENKKLIINKSINFNIIYNNINYNIFIYI